MTKRNKIWIDLDNSPHIPFFYPIIREMEKRGFNFVLTARDCSQTCGLADLYNLSYTRLGRHYGKNKILKVVGLILRSLQLAPFILREKPDLALSHGSRPQILLSAITGIPSVLIYDYEHVQLLPFADPTYVIVPEVIPDSIIKHFKKRFIKYPGIKEDVYASNFNPKNDMRKMFNIGDDEIMVTVRPPATDAHYHNPESEGLFSAVIERLCESPTTHTVILPRNEKQAELIKRTYPLFFKNGKLVIPSEVVDGLNLIWFSDLVISGGGTMNREAAALGVTV